MLNTRVHRVIQVILLSVCLLWATSQQTRAETTPADQPITHGNPTQPRIALTFDACETPRQKPGFDAAIVNELISTNTPATFFLGGLWMQSYPTTTQQLAANPLFEIGSHSWSHPDFARITPTQMKTEIARTQDELLHLTGRTTTLFRFPFGHYNVQAMHMVEDMGLIPIQWDVVSADPSRSQTAQRMIYSVTHHVQDGSIIIMHVNGRGWHTAEALPKIIAALKVRGFQFVTVSQLLASGQK